MSSPGVPQRISSSQVEGLKNDVLAIINKVDGMKYNMQTQDFRQITNHLQYVMTTLRNVSNIEATQVASPFKYNAMASMTGPKVQYNPDGTTKIVNVSKVNTTGEAWESQFDQSMLINPPCYMLPPSSLTNIDVIRQTGEGHRMKGL